MVTQTETEVVKGFILSKTRYELIYPNGEEFDEEDRNWQGRISEKTRKCCNCHSGNVKFVNLLVQETDLSTQVKPVLVCMECGCATTKTIMQGPKELEGCMGLIELEGIGLVVVLGPCPITFTDLSLVTRTKVGKNPRPRSNNRRK